MRAACQRPAGCATSDGHLTGTYDVLEKLRSGGVLKAKERVIREEGLVALNAERADEEKRGLVRWLRPESRNPGDAKAATQEALPASDDEDGEPAAKPAAPRGSPGPPDATRRISP